jgi:hypothetical protein
MNFNEAMQEIKQLTRKKAKPEEHVKACEKNTMTKDPKKYPKNNMYAWDTGITDRGPSGFPSDINALTGKEKIGSYKDYKIGK